MENNFCSNCGAPLGRDSRFCRNCGMDISKAKKLSKPAYTNKLAIPAGFKKGLVSTKACSLVFTESEIIAALTDKTIMKRHIASAREKAAGNGFIKKTAAVMKSGYTFSDRYVNMLPETIKSENPGNFTIPYNTVRSVRYKRGTTNYSYDDTTTTSSPPSMTVKTMSGKYVFSFDTGYKTRELIALLRNTFPGGYKGPKR